MDELRATLSALTADRYARDATIAEMRAALRAIEKRAVAVDDFMADLGYCHDDLPVILADVRAIHVTAAHALAIHDAAAAAKGEP